MSSESRRKKRRVAHADAGADADARPESQAQAPPDDELCLYADKRFWQDRYERERATELGGGSRGSAAGDALFEWCAPWSSIRELVRAVAPDVGGAVLELGCGSSTLALDMHRDGYSDVLAVDFAPAAVEVRHPACDLEVHCPTNDAQLAVASVCLPYVEVDLGDDGGGARTAQ